MDQISKCETENYKTLGRKYRHKIRWGFYDFGLNHFLYIKTKTTDKRKTQIK